MGAEVCSSVKVNQEHTNKQPTLKLVKQNVAIKSKATNGVLDICQDKDAFGTLIIYEDYKQKNQRFDILQATQDVYYIRSCKSEKYLTVGSNSEKNYAPIFEQPISGVKGQKFRLESLGGNEYFIHTFCGKVLDLHD